jgi:hypothetical protein
MFIKVGGDEGDEISKNFFISEFGYFPYMKKFYGFFWRSSPRMLMQIGISMISWGDERNRTSPLYHSNDYKYWYFNAYGVFNSRF